MHVYEESYYIMPFVGPIHANLRDANLRDANLRGARLWSAYLAGVKANSSTICPNGIRRGTAGNDCGF